MNTTDYLINKYGLGSPKTVEKMTRIDLYRLFAELGFKTGCEVGVYQGENAGKMFEMIPDLKLYCVEPYAEEPYSTRHRTEEFFASMKKLTYDRVGKKNSIILEKFSEDAVKHVPYDCLDFVYIDGDHSYDYVMLDIILWSRRVKKGGIVSGHDYTNPEMFRKTDVNIKEAVDDYLAIHKINQWYLTDKHASRDLNDRCQSWFFVKQ